VHHVGAHSSRLWRSTAGGLSDRGPPPLGGLAHECAAPDVSERRLSTIGSRPACAAIGALGAWWRRPLRGCDPRRALDTACVARPPRSRRLRRPRAAGTRPRPRGARIAKTPVAPSGPQGELERNSSRVKHSARRFGR